MMPWAAQSAAFLIAFVAIAHSYLGERYILIRLMRRVELPRLYGSDIFTRRTLRFAWHVTSVAWIGLAALLLPALRGVPAGHVIGLTFFASAVLGIIITHARHLVWIVFVAIAAGAWTATAH